MNKMGDQKYSLLHNAEELEPNYTHLSKGESDVEDKLIPKPNDSDYLCGLGGFKPNWIQRFATPQTYLLIFGIVGVLEGAYFTYFIGVLSTLEKRFAFESKVSGIILIADNISGAFLSLIVGYYARKWHKPRLIAFGMSMVSVSCFICTIPYFMYGPALHLLTREQIISKEKDYCGSETIAENCEHKGSISPPVIILFMANLLWGCGYTAYYTIGTPYLDDNVEKKDAPMYFGMYLFIFFCLCICFSLLDDLRELSVHNYIIF